MKDEFAADEAGWYLCQMLQVSGLYIYPIKSMAGISVNKASVADSGFEHDRRGYGQGRWRRGRVPTVGCANLAGVCCSNPAIITVLAHHQKCQRLLRPLLGETILAGQPQNL